MASELRLFSIGRRSQGGNRLGVVAWMGENHAMVCGFLIMISEGVRLFWRGSDQAVPVVPV